MHETERNSAFMGIINSMEHPELQRDLLGNNPSRTVRAKKYLFSRLDRLTPPEQTELGVFIIDGLSFGTYWWDSSTRETVSKVFSHLNLTNRNTPDAPSLEDAYFRSVKKQSKIPVPHKSVNELLSLGEVLGSVLFDESKINEASSKMRQSWYEVIAQTTAAEDQLDIAEKLEQIMRKKQTGRKRGPEQTVRRAIILSHLVSGKEAKEIGEMLDVPPERIHEDIGTMRAEGIEIRKRYRGGKPIPAVTQRREQANLLRAEGHTRQAIADQLDVSVGTVNAYLYREPRRRENNDLTEPERRRPGRKPDPVVAQRREEAKRLRDAGHTRQAIADQLDVSIGTVNAYLYRDGEKSPGRKPDPAVAQRREEAKRLRDAGHTRQAIAATLGASVSTVSDYLYRKQREKPRQDIQSSGTIVDFKKG